MSAYSEAPAFPKLQGNPNLKGLTKREYFAAAALQGLLASGEDEKTAVVMAVQAGDHLFAELGRTEFGAAIQEGIDSLDRGEGIPIEEIEKAFGTPLERVDIHSDWEQYLENAMKPSDSMNEAR